MSITSALNSALTGLTATSRQAEAVSNNVANATTSGYARRSVSLSALNLGGSGQGVRVVGITRHADLYLINDRRGAQAAAGESATKAGFLNRLETILGTTESPGSLVSRVSTLDTTLIEAASHPESEARLSAAVSAARSLATGLNQASEAIQAERLKAEKGIASAVESLNSSLRQVQELNRMIASHSGSGRDVSALMDQRQQVIDSIASIIPLKEMPRDGNQVALISAGGAVLLDGNPVTFGFTEVHTIVPEMTQASGGLYGLTINGKPMATTGSSSMILGGELGALFAVRDELAVEGQSLLDAMARDMIERFSAAGLDPTFPAGAPGLFTDGGLAFDPADEVGLASRIALNFAADPLKGGEVTRLRDGLGAPMPGAVGNSTLLNSLSTALNTNRTIASLIPGGSRSLAGLAAAILSRTSSQRVTQETEQSYTAARYTALSDIEAASGVNTDEELQSLLVIEKNYAANARVIQVVDEMIRTLLGL
ncbi:flagellar hook-associated protein FlgK [Pseudomonas sp. GX19020]|uniref:flagellar hook-associated protein FlgK n=1 Tax=Pseudomonas sp. GX19020 TaxID=2942277 RepID=UPI002018FFBB|nr:flagellar hook-associated protein FlgK [Pseudomonas sp. GX19020]MCL4066148.1 flagellar hook-associated protein FlgK [Pseudomonas sp. GX19020]